jgi:two-component system chemotaxis sensor kinase CheA
MKFKTQLFLCFGIIYGIYAVLHVYLWTKMDSYDKEMRISVKSYNVLTLTNTIQDGLNIYSKESRDLITNPPEELKEKFTKNRDKALQKVNISIDSLQKLDKSKESQEIVQQLITMIKSYTTIDKDMDALIKEGKHQEAAQLYWNKGQEIREKTIGVSNQLQTMQSKTTDKDLDQSSKSYDRISKLTTEYVILYYLI